MKRIALYVVTAAELLALLLCAYLTWWLNLGLFAVPAGCLVIGGLEVLRYWLGARRPLFMDPKEPTPLKDY